MMVVRLLLQPAPLADELARLEGHRVATVKSGYVIEDVAGEGKPIVGVVEKRGSTLYLEGHRLTGPLARPRIAGPGYKVWALGTIAGDTLRLRRIGILARPALGARHQRRRLRAASARQGELSHAERH